MAAPTQVSQAHEDAGRARVSEREARRVAEAARQTEWELPSFAKELYLGRFRPDLIAPHPRTDPETAARGEAYLEHLAAYLSEHVDGRQIERDARIPDEVVAGLAELGTFGIKIPREYGGLGLGQVHYNRALMLLGSVSASIGALVSAHQSIGVPEPVKQFGSEEQKRAFLPRCAAGAISAFLLTEPDVGSDPARLHATATPTEDGDYLLDGVKLWSTNGVVAELLVVMARVPASEGHRGGITAFVVEADSPGITVERRNAFMGLRGLENGVTRFHRVRVPAANVLGREGAGLKIALTTLNAGRLSIPALCVGASKWCLKVGREWARERVQWGKPVGRHAAVAHKIAFMAATTYAQEAVLELAGHLADAGRTDIRIEAALAKLFTSEMAWKVADELVQVRGGRGYETADSLAARGERAVPVEQVLRDLRINRIFEGSTEIMHLLIAREAVDAHLAVAGDLVDPDAGAAVKARAAARAGAFYATWFPPLLTGPGQLPTAYPEYGPLATHLRYVERASRRLARATFYGMVRWQGGLEQRQGFLGRVVDIGAELFAMAAVCVRAQMQRADDGAAGERAVRLAAAWCRHSRRRVDRLFTELWDNTDDADEQLAAEVLDGTHAWAEAGILDPSEGTGPWIASGAPGPSAVPDVSRRMVPPRGR
ncbi:acyl-CoA dehydrogenase family protein [Georgenia thermotolerans]|uniref:Acyl-CoA dehydrogenase n=1 Tax=Georgenia thermotolerans TaxID=527326 RepID=A0A7J5ULH5_9MICO|nr:acyl-CoA dehydrogenase family protein [Georgenia thermotolerans]KAE8763121.1 acyl-CoA dehydrogenase [Georgenia thermotolerans]